MGREEHVVQFPEGMVLGERFLVEDVEPGAFDPPFLEGLDKGRFRDYGAAADIDDDCGGLHGGQFFFADEAAGVFGERGGGYYVVADCHHGGAVFEGVELVDDGVRGEFGAAAEGYDFHAQGVGALGGGAADFAVAYDAEGAAVDLLYVELFPDGGFLIADHAAEVLGEEEHGGYGEFAEGAFEDAASVGDGDGAFDQFREERAFDAGREGVDPLDFARGVPDLLEGVADVHSIEDDVGFGSGGFEGVGVAADGDGGGIGQLFEDGQVLGVGVRDDKEVQGRHQCKISTLVGGGWVLVYVGVSLPFSAGQFACWYNTNKVEVLLTKDRAKAKLNRCLDEGTVIYSKHFRDELANDDLTTEDILAVCRSGAITMAPEKDIKTGQWKYRIEGITADRREVAVVFTFRPGMAVFITVFERTL